MRTTSISTVSYHPGTPPTDPAQLQRFLSDELQKIAGVITALAAGHIDKSFKAPTKPRDGNLAYASGPGGWDPGGGKGLYLYNGTSWVLIKAV